MAVGRRSNVFEAIDRVFNRGTVRALPDREPLGRAVADYDAIALESLVARHGPMVLGVCRRVLSDPNDVDDAFQATFLILITKAHRLRDADRLGSWLYRVAFRVAVRARQNAARRTIRERAAARTESSDRSLAPDLSELSAILDEEISRLSERYQRAIVLCYLEGHTQDEAARVLHLSPGALRGRLDRARAQLQARLDRRGFAPSLLPAALTSTTLRPATPAPLVRRLLETVANAATASAASAGLAAEVLRAAWLFRLKTVATVFAATALFATLPMPWPQSTVKNSLPPPNRPVPVAAVKPAADANQEAAGIVVTGRVVDQTGRPIAGARVARGKTLSDAPNVETTTDAHGRFTFSGVDPGELILTAQAVGHAPELKTLNVSTAQKTVEIPLAPGHTIRGRLVDLDGKPIAGAPVSIASWRGHATLRWNSKTDAEGRYRWDDAPSDAVLIDLGTLGYTAKRFLSLKPAEKERELTMPRAVYVHGTVKEEITQKPIQSFRIIPGYTSGGKSFPTWLFSEARPASNGAFEIKLGAEYRAFDRVVRIEAEGYQSAVSSVFPAGTKSDSLTFNFSLRPGAAREGIVQAPDGSPLAGAKVLLIDQSGARVHLTNGEPPPDHTVNTRETDASGRFSFPTEDSPQTVFVLHERGFVQSSFDALKTSPVLTIRPWARIRGTLRIGPSPAAGQQVMLSPQMNPGDLPANPYFQGFATTDQAGRFELPRVVPGIVEVARQIKLNDDIFSSTSSVRLELNPGQTAEIAIGGVGRPVVGRVTLPENLAGRVDWRYSNNGLSIRNEDNPARPGTAAKPTLLRNCDVLVSPDGRFRIEDVLAGRYQLGFTANRPPAPGESLPWYGGEALGSARINVEVPEMPGGRSDEPLDVGTISLTPAQPR